MNNTSVNGVLLNSEQQIRFDEVKALEYELETLILNVYGDGPWGRSSSEGSVDPYIKDKVQKLLSRYQQITGAPPEAKISAVQDAHTGSRMAAENSPYLHWMSKGYFGSARDFHSALKERKDQYILTGKLAS